MTPKFLKHSLKLLFAAHHFVFNSEDPKSIADVLNVKKSKIQYWMKSDEWIEAISYWRGGRPKKEGDLGLAEKVWTEIIENGDDFSAVEYPDRPIKSPRNDNTYVYALIQSHLFCVDNLCDAQIHARLAEEREYVGEPVRYEGQRLGNLYHWWLFPNWDEGIFSKALARINAAGDLVVGTGENTCLVIIRHGRLTLTRQISDKPCFKSLTERLLG